MLVLFFLISSLPRFFAMWYNQQWALALLPSLSSITHAQITTANIEPPANANHIFNAIRSTMRHWETSIHPIGMGFYLAAVPKGTRFYHGTGTPDPITGLEWLAFKPEHSLGFAHRSGQKHKRKPQSQSQSKQENSQKVLDPAQHHSAPSTSGYLHTYATARDLRLLYIDGMSAGPGGALESQDRILFNDTITDSTPLPDTGLGGPPNEQRRAVLGCKMAREEWGGRIDGIVRTEGDFEIILCSFERDLELVRISQAKPQVPSRGGGHGRGPRPGGKYWSLDNRFDELLGASVKVDFDHFVSVITYGLDLFPGNVSRPRLGHVPSQQFEPVRRDIKDMVYAWTPSVHPFDWQAVADMIVFRYSDEIQRLAKGEFSDAAALQEYVENLLEPFIDYAAVKSREEIVSLCRDEFIASTAPVDSLGGRAVRFVSGEVCSVLTEVLLSDSDLAGAVARFRELQSYLGWATWQL